MKKHPGLYSLWAFQFFDSSSILISLNSSPGLHLPESSTMDSSYFYTLLRSSDFYYNAVILVLAATIVAMWLEFR